MKTEKEKYLLLKENMMDGYAYHQIVKDSSGTPVDYIFLDVNPFFEAITGLARDDILGKTATEVLLETKESGFDWIGTYGQVAITGKPTRFEHYSAPLNRWYEVSAYSGEYGYFVAVFRDITEAKRADKAFVVSEVRYRRLFESAKDGILILDSETGKIINVNPFLVELLGYSEEEILGKTIWEIGTLKDIVANQDNFLELQQKEYIRYENLPLQTAEGRQIAVEFVSNVYQEGQHQVIQCNIRDITERKRAELFQNLSGEVLAILNEPGGLHDSIQRILSIMKLKTGLDAVGLRLQRGDDFPYYAQDGFSEDFLSVENSLVTREPGGDICRNADGSISLECTCGLVISGKTDPSNSLFTPGGSCWTNDSFPLLELPASSDPRLQPRNQCIHQGYASVALVPIRKNRQIVGLLQLNDHRKGQFNRDAINALEEIAIHIGEALVRKQMEETLRESEQNLSSILNNMTDAIWSLLLPDMSVIYVSPSVEKIYGRSVEEFVKNPSLWQEVVHPDDQHLTKETFAQLYEEGKAERECRIVRPDGSIVWIYDKSQLIYDEKQVSVRIEGIASDITERKQAEESLKKRLAELEAIYTVSSTLRTAETLDEMLTLLLGETLKVLDTTAGAICLYHPASGQLRFTTTQGWFSGLDDAFLKPGEGIAGKVFTLKKALLSREYAKDARVEYTEKIPEGWGGVCLPLQTAADVVGTLFVSVPLPREITSEELKLLTSLTEMAGTAIHRIGLFEKNIRHLEQVQALRNIDMAISGNLDLRFTFRIILDEVTRLLNVDAAAILRLDAHTGILKYEAWRGFRITDPAKLNLSMGEGLAGQAAMERKSMRIASPSEIEGDPVQGPLMAKENAHTYWAVPLINKGRVEGVLEIFHREPLDASEEWLEFLETLAGQTAIAINNAELVHSMANTNFKLLQAYDNTIKGWAHALDLRDKNTEEHSQRVTELTVKFAREMGMSEEELAHVRRGALLQDIGKMGVSDAVLLKPGPLTAEEWAIMHRHPIHAFELLSPIAYLRPALDIPYCHHEKWDGTGYPRGLKREEIPLAARIFAVVDVYDALTSDRPYSKAWTREEALEHIRQENGRHFDPQVVEMFLEEVKKEVDCYEKNGHLKENTKEVSKFGDEREKTKKMLEYVNTSQRFSLNNIEHCLLAEHKLQQKVHALRESEAKFRAYMEKSPLGIFVTDMEGHYVEVNRAACQMSGYTEEELLNLSIPDFLAPEFLEKGMKSFERLLTEGYVEDEIMVRKKNGETFWINLASVIVDSNRVIAFCQDITERKEKEERAKELNCLHSFSRLLQKEKNNLEKILQETVKLLPPSFQYPEDASACITFRGREFKTQDYEPTPWKISAHLELYGEHAGTIEVCYHKPPLQGREPFMKEEKLVLETVAVHLSHATEQMQAKEDLQKSNNKLSVTLHSIGDGVIATDTNGKITRLNPQAEKLTGWAAEEAWGLAVHEVFHIVNAKTGEPVPNPVHRVIDTSRTQGLANDTILVARDGTKRQIADSAAPIRDDEGKMFGVVMVFSDVTERKNAEGKLKFQNIILKVQQEVTLDGILVVNERVEIVSFNQRFADIWEIPGDIMASQSGQKALDYVLPKLVDPEKFVNLINYLNKNKQEKSFEEIALTDGRILELYSAPMLGDNEHYYGRVYFYRDITERKQAEEKVRYQSFHDGLTGLYNRVYLEKEMERLDTERQLPIGIIMADLNGLKLANDTFGHEVGDEMLKQTAEILRSSCRREDIIARWGGDEFVIFLTQTTEEDAKAICQRIDEKCKETYVKDMPLSLAVGAAIKNNTNTDLAEIQKEAEENMYKHKRAESQQEKSATLKIMLKNLEAKSFETEAHYSGMQNAAQRIGKGKGLPKSELNRLEMLIPLHDLGEINISAEILTKKGPLSAEEWEIIKKHPETGYRIVRAAEEFVHVAEDIRSHHERWDGSGYPQGLKGKEIPLLARITAIADAYEVMSSGRSYNKAMSKSEIVAELKRFAGSQFDPGLIEIFLLFLETETETEIETND